MTLVSAHHPWDSCFLMWPFSLSHSLIPVCQFFQIFFLPTHQLQTLFLILCFILSMRTHFLHFITCMKIIPIFPTCTRQADRSWLHMFPWSQITCFQKIPLKSSNYHSELKAILPQWPLFSQSLKTYNHRINFNSLWNLTPPFFLLAVSEIYSWKKVWDWDRKTPIQIESIFKEWPNLNPCRTGVHLSITMWYPRTNWCTRSCPSAETAIRNMPPALSELRVKWKWSVVVQDPKKAFYCTANVQSGNCYWNCIHRGSWGRSRRKYLEKAKSNLSHPRHKSLRLLKRHSFLEQHGYNNSRSSWKWSM